MTNDQRISELVRQAAEAHRGGKLEEAMQTYERILEKDEDCADAVHLLGVLKVQEGSVQEGIRLIRRAVELRPECAAYYRNLAVAYATAGETEQQANCYARVLDLEPESSDMAFELARIFRNLGKNADAFQVLQQQLMYCPADPKMLTELGITADLVGRSASARQFLQLGLSFGAPPAPTLTQLGAVFQKSKVYQQAIDCYTNALKTDPANSAANWNLAIAHAAVCEQVPHGVTDLIRKSPDDYAGIATPFEMLTVTEDAKLLQQVAMAWTLRHAPPHPHPLCDARADLGRQNPNRRLRIGYLSDELRDHPMGHLMAGLFGEHDRTVLEIKCFYFGPPETGEVLSQIRSNCDQWVDLRHHSPRAAARSIYDSGVDILVDLKGHVCNARPAILASRPAPIQVNWLGYPGTTGTSYVDYIIADHYVIPSEQEDCFTEKIVRLPDSYQVNDSNRPIVPSRIPRTAHGLPPQGFVYCCFNQLHKIRQPTFRRWMNILTRVPDSVLWLLSGPAEAQSNLLAAAELAGVHRNRIIFAAPLPHHAHLGRMQHGDLFLDTLPYGAHATASDALWAGLPILTQRGDSFAGRVAFSLLANVQLPELVADSADEYCEQAIRLGTDPDEHNRIRKQLVREPGARRLFDTGRFARNLSTAFQKMWALHLDGRPPQSFSVLKRSQEEN